MLRLHDAVVVVVLEVFMELVLLSVYTSRLAFGL
jgi:hypothetical protein